MNDDVYYDEIQRLKQLTSVSDWDAYGAPPLNPKLWDDAGRIAACLHDVYGKPYFSPATDGSVHLHWSLSDGTRLTIEIGRIRQ